MRTDETTNNYPKYDSLEELCYQELLPLAIECGMTSDMFWYEDERLFSSYIKAYYKRVNFTGWLNGIYMKNAFEVVLANAFAKKGSKAAEYFKTPLDLGTAKNEVKKPSNAIDLDKKFRDKLRAWF